MFLHFDLSDWINCSVIISCTLIETPDTNRPMMPLAQAHLFAIVIRICNKTLQLLIFSQSTPITSRGQQANIVVIIALKQSPKVLLSLAYEKLACVEDFWNLFKLSVRLFISGLTLVVFLADLYTSETGPCYPGWNFKDFSSKPCISWQLRFWWSLPHLEDFVQVRKSLFTLQLFIISVRPMPLSIQALERTDLKLLLVVKELFDKINTTS